MLLAAAFLLFFKLGSYFLWDDEAAQALVAEQVWRTGDTSAVVGRNIIAYNFGAELSHLHDRANPPLPAYLMAPFVGWGGRAPLWARLPFALCGLAFVALVLRWLGRARADATTWVLVGAGFLGNVSLWLYFREARYYGLVLACSLGIAYLYLSETRSPRRTATLSLLLLCVLASHYMTYAAVCAVLLVDYAGWQRRTAPLTRQDWKILLAPQLILGGAVFAVWNPFRTRTGVDEFANSLRERAELFWWNLRDLNRCEFGAGVLLLVALGLGLGRPRHRMLLRGSVALLVYCAALALVSPKVMRQTSPIADVRYLLPVLPLSVALGALALREMIGRRGWLALPVAALIFGTNLANGGPLLPEGLRSSIAGYVLELFHPWRGAYRATALWITEHVPPGSSIWVNPGYAAYPLIYHAPRMIYAWQLHNPPEPQFAGLDPIHFYGSEPPDYFIAFGPYVEDTRRMISTGRSLQIDYEPVAIIDSYWEAVHRPELTDHRFQPVTDFDRQDEAIYVFRLVR